MSAWDDYFEAERKRVIAMFEHLDVRFPVAPAPTRKDTIVECWKTARMLWPTHATEAGLIVEHDLGIIAPVHFERRRYGDVMVVEAEGVIVERVVIHG